MSRRIMVGTVPVGGGAPVAIQSMCTTRTGDPAATIAQIQQLTEAGCEIVRVAVPDLAAARAIGAIRPAISIPLVADIHFDYTLALEAVAAGADKIRINPGNIGEEAKIKAVALVCREGHVPVRIGVNSGSLEKPLLQKYGGVTAAGMVESALGQAALFRQWDFDDICISLKASSPALTIAANRILAKETDYPLHLGVTESGLPPDGLLKSAIGIGGLLCMGIGDTIRVSLTAHPVEEIRAAKQILSAAGLLREGPEIISCPTCGRTKIDLIPLAQEVAARLKGCPKKITVAVMGCPVNGPGEARAADVGIAGGDGAGVLFCRGEIVKQVPQDQLVDALIALIDTM